MGYYIIQVYVPCIFLVMLSWIVFWMRPDDSASRLTVGITTILTIVFLLGYTNGMLPKVLRMLFSTPQLVAKRVETLLTFGANFRHLDNYNVYPPYPPLISVVCIGEGVGAGGVVQMSMNSFFCQPGCVFREIAGNRYFLLTVSQQFCN